MAIREIRLKGDEILSKKCREVTVFDNKLAILLDDLYETMKKHEGVGLAAPQVGILKRVVVVDTGNGRIDLVNPTVIKKDGTQTGSEGCLSFPGIFGDVERPMDVTVRAQDKDGKWFEISGHELTARAFCHEIDHLDGKLFVDKVIKFN